MKCVTFSLEMARMDVSFYACVCAHVSEGIDYRSLYDVGMMQDAFSCIQDICLF
jgi:hypothetical protein